MAQEEHDDVPGEDGTDPQQRGSGPRVFLVRHADSGGPRDPVLGMHLSDPGRRQARALAARLANWQVDAILCSDMHRARETAVAVHSFHLDTPLIVDPTFREASAGALAAYERGEPGRGDLHARMEAAWERITTLPFRVAVIVTHNGLIKYLLGRTIQYEGSARPRLHSALTGITGIHVRARGRALLRFFNDTHHLTPELAVEECTNDKVWIEDSATGRWRFGGGDGARAKAFS